MVIFSPLISCCDLNHGDGQGCVVPCVCMCKFSICLRRRESQRYPVLNNLCREWSFSSPSIVISDCLSRKWVNGPSSCHECNVALESCLLDNAYQTSGSHQRFGFNTQVFAEPELGLNTFERLCCSGCRVHCFSMGMGY